MVCSLLLICRLLRMLRWWIGRWGWVKRGLICSWRLSSQRVRGEYGVIWWYDMVLYDMIWYDMIWYAVLLRWCWYACIATFYWCWYDCIVILWHWCCSLPMYIYSMCVHVHLWYHVLYVCSCTCTVYVYMCISDIIYSMMCVHDITYSMCVHV